MLRPALVLANFPCALVRELHIKACNFTTTSNLISQWMLRLKTARQRLLAIRLFILLAKRKKQNSFPQEAACMFWGGGSPGRKFIRKEAG